MKILKKIRNYFCYCGIEKDLYRKIKKDAYVSNFQVWRILHILMDLAFTLLFIFSLINDLADENRWFYLGALLYSLAATIPFFVVKKKDSVFMQLLIYLSISVLFLFACFITTNSKDMKYGLSIMNIGVMIKKTINVMPGIDGLLDVIKHAKRNKTEIDK